MTTPAPAADSRPFTIPNLLLVVALAAVLHLPRLADTGTFLDGDELFAAMSAQSIAATGRDLSGRLFPLYFQMRPFRTDIWFQPIPIYSLAAVLTVLPISEGTVRLPMAIAGVLDIVLMYLVGKQLFRRESLALGAAALLALTPAHFAHSRIALDFQAHLPFILGWLLCLLIYLRNERRAWLFGAGLMLGIGLYTYLAAYMLMPLYAVLTGLVLYRRREPLNRYGALAAGFLLPASLGLIFLARQSVAAVDVFLHYQRGEGQFEAVRAPGGPALLQRLVEHLGVYASFWTPRVLFVYGRQSFGLLRAMLPLPMAGLLVVAIVRLIVRPSTTVLLLAAGLAAGPLPASLVPQPEAIHRVAAMLPFFALLSIAGLEYVSRADSSRARALAFVATWGSIIGLSLIYQPDLRGAQALVRAATVPLAAAGLAVILKDFTVDSASLAVQAMAGVSALVGTEIAFYFLGYGTMLLMSVGLMLVICSALLWPGVLTRVGRQPGLISALLAVMTSMFIHMYVDFTRVPLIPFIPWTAKIVGPRFLAASGALAAVAWLVRRLSINATRRTELAVVVGLVLTQLGYFYIDANVSFAVRFLQVTAVLLGTILVAMLCRRDVVDGFVPSRIATAAVIAMCALQFAQFQVMFVQGLPLHRQNADAYQQRVVFESVIDRMGSRTAPAVYLANMGPYAEMYWRFYGLKHKRADLAAHVVRDAALVPGRIQGLAVGSIAIVQSVGSADTVVAHLSAAGQVSADLVRGQDGASSFWVLERRAP